MIIIDKKKKLPCQVNTKQKISSHKKKKKKKLLKDKNY